MKDEICDFCDGIGWYEGGKKAIKTPCEKCNGTGIIIEVPKEFIERHLKNIKELILKARQIRYN